MDRSRSSAAWALLGMMRPANMLTAGADVLAGAAVGYFFHGESSKGLEALPWLLGATLCLYAGGIVFNDIFDEETDRLERPERALPSGRISRRAALFWGILLLLAGCFLALAAGRLSGWVAGTIAILAIVYDAYAKQHAFLGPLTMGSCRGANLLLGATALGSLSTLWPIAALPLFFIAAVTLVSRGEVQSRGRSPLYAALGLYLLLLLALGALSIFFGKNDPVSLAFVTLFALVVLPPLLRAIRKPVPDQVGKAVKWGVLGLIPMDAALGCIFTQWQTGLLILLLLPLSIGLARIFAVT